MISCREFADFIGAYVDGDLPAGQLAAFRRHMDACPWCVAYLESYGHTIALGKAACAEEGLPADVPEELVRAVLAALRTS